MNHIWKLCNSYFISSKSCFQGFNKLTTFLNVCWIVLSWTKIRRTFYSVSELKLITSKKLLKSKWRMKSHNSNEPFIFSGKLKCFPDSPAKSYTKEMFDSFAMKEFQYFLELMLHLLLTLSFNIFHNIWRIQLPFVGFHQNLRKKHFITHWSKNISCVSMSTTSCSKYVRYHDNSALSISNMIDRYSLPEQIFSLWLIIDLKLGPWSFRAATMHQDML